LSDHVERNRAHWDEWAHDYVETGRRQWAADEPSWGVWGVLEEDLRMLPSDLDGRDAIELGCGTGYVSSWLARRGARVVGIDNSAAQLGTARSLQREHGLDFELIHGNAETVPKPDASFDFAISEYGASIWCDPYLWIPEAARLLRPGGRLVFLTNSVLVTLCVPEEEGFAAEQLQRPQHGLGRVTWPGGGTEFHPGHGDWIRVLTATGFTVESLHELYAPAGSATPDYYEIATAEWAARWPVEDLWSARLA
jgi:SAM-dependent methyltransferase